MYVCILAIDFTVSQVYSTTLTKKVVPNYYGIYM